MNTHLLQKYNVPGPRYTSYPTVPYWDTKPVTEHRWKGVVNDTFEVSNETEGISLYIHLPFCERLCTYCGCNTRITVNHKVEHPYIDALLKEWQLYVDGFPARPKLREIHLGGGTPTFFSPENLRRLINGLLEKADVHPKHEFGFEAHPANTTDEHLEVLHEVGFRRISIGVQDFNPIVLELINRPQTYQQVQHLTEKAREIGYTSVNFDLVYGLPRQRVSTMAQTISEVIRLRPDRIALYSYAHVPWVKPGQRKFTEEDLPDAAKKLTIYDTCRDALELAGYTDIGMDHFSLPTDGLYEAVQHKRLHRNFMGYTTTQTHLLIGLGVSAISDSWWGYAQNEKTVEQYYERLKSNELPLFRGHMLTRQDLILRRHIQRLMCQFETSWDDSKDQCKELYDALARLEEPEKDGLVLIEPYHLTVTEKGRNFIRNISMAFDARLWNDIPQTAIFSKVF
ncbi:oxygen-independent coproporphyrinogen III oxidase [Runella slithyformis]|uniref:Coproporphyrinogen-III oxidase n=1 Tax=Runella slithyformis (strain ATCC 29530 / DSM 19594 / LMG 11500 / NCIMB 11436 / LSU 4) TaxID=761193 RepID=A0A7U4E8C5_RUNSL|nr:oxygen-independent coproporphyrinogen III oxidase [Runella slithyformis]AEI51551.1 oxygen-independent coproporphyrinogen III oxidase [Runella slithyformis DSM 19594]